MTISMDKNYTTRDGRPVRLLCVDGPLPYPVVGLVAGDETPACWTADGGHMQEEITCHDLIEAKPKVQCEVWMYRKPEGYLEFQEAPYSKAAIDHFGLTLVARVTIDVEEGYGLEDEE